MLHTQEKIKEFNARRKLKVSNLGIKSITELGFCFDHFSLPGKDFKQVRWVMDDIIIKEISINGTVER